ncbi:MAG TPA: DUF4037 domain-containing protein [Chthonomonadaceae bacterium]|nr:DUF4037 domain-containing protein [Chthonomonadaceae bacterium]
MQNRQSAWRFAKAQDIATRYAQQQNVEAILIGGSVARGCADRFSDVEVGVFWRELPPPAVHAALMQQAGGQDWVLDPFDPETEDVQFEEYAVSSLKIDMRHMTVAGMERILASVVDNADANEARQGLVYVVRHGLPLYGQALLAGWRQKTDLYPEALAYEMARRSLDLPPWDYMPLYIQRGDLLLFSCALAEAVQAIFRALCGVNREYYPGLKWMNDTLRSFALQPANTAARLHRLFRVPPGEAAEAVRDLVEETFDLAERTLPGLDLSQHRANFRYTRPVAEAPSP